MSQAETGERVAAALRRAGFRRVDTTEFSSGRYTVDFQVEAEMPWERENMLSSVSIGTDGGYGEVALRPPGVDESRLPRLTTSAETAARAGGEHWSYMIATPEYHPEDRKPHLYRDSRAPHVPPEQLVREIVRVLKTYRRSMYTGQHDFDFF